MKIKKPTNELFWRASAPWCPHVALTTYIGNPVRYNQKARIERTATSIVTESGEQRGVVIPADLLYIAHAKNPMNLAAHPLRHVELDAFRNDPYFYIDALNDNFNLVFIVKGRIDVAIATSRFRDAELVIKNQQGQVDFNRSVKSYFYGEGVKPVFLTYKEELEQLYQALGPDLGISMRDWIIADRQYMALCHDMRDEDELILADVKNALKEAANQSPAGYAALISRFRISPEMVRDDHAHHTDGPHKAL